MFGDSRISSLLLQIVGKDCPSGPNGAGRRAFGQHFTQTELAFKHADGTFDPAAKPLQFSKPLGALVLGFTGRQPTDFGDAHSAHLKASKLKQVLRAVESSIRGNCLGPLTENLFGLADQRKQMNLIAGIAVMDFVMNDHSRVILHQLQRTTKFDRLLCGCQVAEQMSPLSPCFSPMIFKPSPTKERLAAMRGTAVCRHTVLACAPLQGTKPRALCLKHRTVRSFSLPVLPVVESFPGAMSPLGSKESTELFVLPHRVFVSSRPPRCAH